MKYVFFLLSLQVCCISCVVKSENQSQIITNSDSIVGGGCEGCEWMYAGMPTTMSNTYTSIGWSSLHQKLQIEGIVYHQDGSTPASGVILYFWHTDDFGLYKSDETKSPSGLPHGRLRGWVKTGKDGTYQIKTSRPAPYPNENIPAHIHISVKEPDIANEYYLDWYFDDDPLYLHHRKKYGQSDRGGTEILRVLLLNDIQVVEHNVILGLNIPNYPISKIDSISSGLHIGEDQPSFMPFHAFGPDAGKRTCPVCEYGRYHGIVYFVGNEPAWNEVEKWLLYLENQSYERKQFLKTYFVYGSDLHYDENQRRKLLIDLGQKLQLKNIALTFVPSWSDVESEVHLNQINPLVKSTMIIYKHRTIVNKFVDLAPSLENFDIIAKVLNDTQGMYFGLQEPHDH